MSENRIIVTVPEALHGKRLDQALAQLCPEHSRARLQNWIKVGNVTVNGKPLRQREAVNAGEQISLLPIFETQADAPRQAIPLDIIHADDEIIILNKPPGLIVHPGAGNPEQTLLNALLYYDGTLEKVPRAGIIQRLDKDTSGIMVVARTPTSHTYLVEQMQQRKIQRTYQAIVTGVMTAGGTVNAPIGRHPVQRKRMAVVERGKPAVSHYRIITKYRSHTHIQVTLESGRTHQIRVHMAHIHYPIVGDPVYAGRLRLPKNASPRLHEALRTFPRQALHAFQLGFVHPATGQEISFTAPLPADILDLLQLLQDEER